MNRWYFPLNVLLVIFILILGISPIFLLKNLECVKTLLNLDIDNSVLIIATIIPLLYSGISLSGTSLSDRIRKKGEKITIERDKINTHILNYNTIILKCVGLYNNLTNQLFYIDNCINELSNNEELVSIINMWKEGTVKKIDYSNDLRQPIKPFIANIVNVYLNSNAYDNNIEYLSNIKIQDIVHEAFTVSDRIFLFGLRNYIDFTEEDKKLLVIFSSFFSDGTVYKNVSLGLVENIENLKKIFESEIRCRNIKGDKLFTLLYNIVLSFLHYIEIVCRETVLLNLFIERLNKNFHNHYKSAHRTHKTLDEMINPAIEIRDENIKQYINIDVLYGYCNIEKTNDA
jgi:SHS2 domain-containing protein